MSFLLKQYKEKYQDELLKELKLKNKMEVPRLEKISINMSLSEAVKNPKILEVAQKELTEIAGQKAVKTKAKKAISNFKLRKGVPLGVRVTLRKQRMWYFLEKLICVSIPKMKDFRGLPSKSFDGRGNYSFGLKDQLIFPEINYDNVDKSRGMTISFSLSAKTDEQGRAFLEKVGFPFKKK